MKIDAILLAAGQGCRFGGNEQHRSSIQPKQFELFDSKPLFFYTLRELLDLTTYRMVWIVVPKGYEAYVHKELEFLKEHLLPFSFQVLQGGKLRQDSLFCALNEMDKHVAPDRVLVHDACRPYLSAGFKERLRHILQKHVTGTSAYIPVIPISDTLKKIKNGTVIKSADRSALFRSQTPQVFDYEGLKTLSNQFQNELEKNEIDSFIFTDESSLYEYYGLCVEVFDGDSCNIKLTYPEEAEILRPLLQRRAVLE